MAIPEDDFRALIEQAHQLKQLTEHPGWAVLVDYLETRMRSDKVAVLNGNVDDRDDYLRRTGRLVGITYAINAPAEVEQLVQNERERRAEHTAD